MPEQKRKLTPEERIEALKKRKDQLNKQIAAAESREKAKDRKEDTRLKILIGSVILAELESRPNLRDKLIFPLFDKYITKEHERQFLIDKGWIKGPEKTPDTGEEDQPFEVQETNNAEGILGRE